MQRAEHDETARALERKRDVPVMLKRGLGVPQRGIEIATGSREQRAAACGRGVHARAGEALAGGRPRREQLLCFLGPPKCGDGLDRVRDAERVGSPGSPGDARNRWATGQSRSAAAALFPNDSSRNPRVVRFMVAKITSP
jgi:hypothetical protein